MAERKRPRVSSSTQTADEGLTEVVFTKQGVNDLVSAAMKIVGENMEQFYEKMEAMLERQRKVDDICEGLKRHRKVVEESNCCEGLEHVVALTRTAMAQDLGTAWRPAHSSYSLRSETERLIAKADECERWVHSVE